MSFQLKKEKRCCLIWALLPHLGLFPPAPPYLTSFAKTRHMGWLSWYNNIEHIIWLHLFRTIYIHISIVLYVFWTYYYGTWALYCKSKGQGFEFCAFQPQNQEDDPFSPERPIHPCSTLCLFIPLGILNVPNHTKYLSWLLGRAKEKRTSILQPPDPMIVLSVVVTTSIPKTPRHQSKSSWDQREISTSLQTFNECS